jgi:hypothetical protein
VDSRGIRKRRHQRLVYYVSIAGGSECHGEVMAYNPRHPIGTRYSVSELKRRRDDWYDTLKNPVVVVLNEKHVAIDRKMVKRLRYACPPQIMKAFFCDRDYENPFERSILDMLHRLNDFGKRVESHFLDPALEALFAEFNARVFAMIRSLDQVDSMENRPELLRFPKNYPNDLADHKKYLEDRNSTNAGHGG